jgi:dimeric dUTPase (all-alpha-NTP-PPase superfamily)
MLELREHFMRELAAARPAVLQNWPVDVSSKVGQQAVRDTVLKGVEEIFESLSHLKNAKAHRLTEVKDFDRDAFLEEFVDALNFFLAVPIMLGITADDLFEAYLKKDVIIHERIRRGY